MYENLNLEGLTAEEYGRWLKAEIAAGRRDASELNHVHVLQWRKDVRYHGNEPEIIVQRRIQIYNTKEWGNDPNDGVQDYLTRAGLNFTVLHKPMTAEEKRRAAAQKKADEPPAQMPDPDEDDKSKAKKSKKEKETISLD